MVERFDIGAAHIHTRTAANCFKTFQNLDVNGCI
jgi:hypothetical protein